MLYKKIVKQKIVIITQSVILDLKIADAIGTTLKILDHEAL